MKKLEITLVWRDGINGKLDIKEIDKIEADNLTQLLSQLLLVIVRIQQKMHEDIVSEMIDSSDDIPF